MPDVRDLRDDVPPVVASILLKMMAKRPEERFGSYEELIAALDHASQTMEGGHGIALAPLEPPANPAASAPVRERASIAFEPAAEEAADSSQTSYDVVSLPDLETAEGDSPFATAAALAAASQAPEPVLRRGHWQDDQTPAGPGDSAEIADGVTPGLKTGASVWIISLTVATVACLLVGFGMTQYFDSTGATDPSADLVNDPSAAADLGDRRPIRAPDATTSTLARPVASRAVDIPINRARSPWREPEDIDESATDSPGGALGDPGRLSQIPEWARTPVPERIDGPFVGVRRVAESSDPSVFATLHMALDRNIGGTVELADEGPLYIDDLRVPGDTRLIRARSGYRPIIRIQAPSLEVVRKQPAVFVLDRKNLILDGIDLIVNARDLVGRQSALVSTPEQRALFFCAGANLTLRNCSVTILNSPGGAPFTFLRIDSSAAHPTRVLLERTLVRGGFATGIAAEGGKAEIVLHQSAIMGGSGPLIQIADRDAAADNRLFVVESLLAGPGPAIEHAAAAAGAAVRPVLIRAFGNAFGRYNGPGIASVISSTNATAPADKLIGWSGDANLFAGWKGFFARGAEPTVVVLDLAQLRSTWSASEQGSQEVLSPWPLPPDAARTLPQDLKPFVPKGDRVLGWATLPRKGLFEKTVDEYPAPVIPQPVGWAIDRPAQPGPGGRRALRVVTAPAVLSDETPAQAAGLTAGSSAAAEDAGELLFDTGAEPWNGDLGAFLQTSLKPSTRRARVRVVGTGSHPFRPVHLPRGLWLEIAVTTVAGQRPPTWSPAPQSTGAGLIELEGGALVLSGVVLQHEETAHLESLINVENSHLVVWQCDFLSRKSVGAFVGDLIAFRAPTTQPVESDPGPPILSGAVGRPVCRIAGSTLITDGAAIKADLGHGLIAVDQTAIAAGLTAIDLHPARVARQRFEADLWLDHCTIAADRSSFHLGPWPGLALGPDRPWLVTSRNCAFLSLSDRRPRETVLLRADADGLARGTLFWQGSDDVIDLDLFIAAAGAEPSANGRLRDIQHQWVDFWGANHIKRVSGPRGTGRGLRVRFIDRPRPGRVERVDLALDPDYHPGADRLTVGALLSRAEPVPAGNARTAPAKKSNRPGRPTGAGQSLPY